MPTQRASQVQEARDATDAAKADALAAQAEAASRRDELAARSDAHASALERAAAEARAAQRAAIDASAAVHAEEVATLRRDGMVNVAPPLWRVWRCHG